MTLQNWLRMMAAADPAQRKSFIDAADAIDTLTSERDDARKIARACHQEYRAIESQHPWIARNV